MRTAPVPTLSEMAENCAHNAQIAKGQLDAALYKRQMAGPPGPPESPNPAWVAANLVVSRFEAEMKHWSGYASHYRSRAAIEGGRTVPATLRPRRGGGLDVVAPPEPPVDRRLPREADDGWDDDKLAEELR